MSETPPEKTSFEVLAMKRLAKVVNSCASLLKHNAPDKVLASQIGLIICAGMELFGVEIFEIIASSRQKRLRSQLGFCSECGIDPPCGPDFFWCSSCEAKLKQQMESLENKVFEDSEDASPPEDGD